ncbi:CBS domain-containing protein, partial [Myxococcus sp. 1LA]
MAHRSTDNGRDETHGARRTLPSEPTAHREADVAPPGSRERAESDLTGWNPARDEESSTRQGRYHRAATLRMALPRTQVDDGTREDAYGAPLEDSGPYGRDDRDSRYATGWGPQHDTGEQDVELAHQRADYRSWDRTGYGGDEPARPVAPQAEASRDARHRASHGEDRHGGARPRYRSPSDAASFPGHR